MTTGVLLSPTTARLVLPLSSADCAFRDGLVDALSVETPLHGVSSSATAVHSIFLTTELLPIISGTANRNNRGREKPRTADTACPRPKGSPLYPLILKRRLGKGLGA